MMVGIIYGLQVSGEEHLIPEFVVTMIVFISVLGGIILYIVKFGKNVEK
jgi:uncharacterized membrane protein YagU involved in acid resistance